MYNTPDDHVTRDTREGVAKLGDLRFRVLDSAGLETEASSGSILGRTSKMTANVLARSNFAMFLIDVRLVSWMTFYIFHVLNSFRYENMVYKLGEFKDKYEKKIKNSKSLMLKNYLQLSRLQLVILQYPYNPGLFVGCEIGVHE